MFLLFFFPYTAPPEIYTLSLHDALPISCIKALQVVEWRCAYYSRFGGDLDMAIPANLRYLAELLKLDRKSTRLNSSHGSISYAVFCLKKKTKTRHIQGSSRRNPEIKGAG